MPKILLKRGLLQAGYSMLMIQSSVGEGKDGDRER